MTAQGHLQPISVTLASVRNTLMS